MNEGEFIYKKGEDSLYQVARILRFDEADDNVHLALYDSIMNIPSAESLSMIRIRSTHALEKLSGISDWTPFATIPVKRRDLEGFYEYLKHTNFNRYLQETGQDKKILIDQAVAAFMEGTRALFERNNPNEALRSFRKAYDTYPLYFEAKELEAQCYIDLSQYPMALKSLMLLIDLDGHNFVRDISIGGCYYRMGDFKNALSWFERAQNFKDIDAEQKAILDEHLALAKAKAQAQV